MGHYVCSWCNIAFGELSVLHLHMGVHIELVGPKGSCSVEIPGGNMVSEVKESSDEQGEYYCKVCQRYFNNLGIFTFHMRAHCEGKSFQCTICGVVFLTKSAVYNHVCSHVSEKLCKCTGGHLALQGKDDQPKIFESANDLHKCGVCDGGYSTKKRLDRHTLKHMGHFSCSICKRSYQGQVEYDKHMVCHAYIMFFRCEVCFETFHDRIKRDDHMKVHSSSHCGFEIVLTDQSGVPKQSTLENGEVLNDCKDISKEKGSKKLKSGCLQESDTNFVPVSTTMTFGKTVRPLVSQDLFHGKKRSDLRSILKDIGVSRGTILMGSEKAKSNTVIENLNDIEVISKESLKEYQATFINGSNIFERKLNPFKESGKYKCKLCFSVWKEKHAFWQHLLEHSDDVPYTCKICVEVFDNVESWKVHTEQKCSCALCGKLMQRIDYAVHNKACPVNNPFKCLVCFKRFSSSDLFREHMKSHSREQACRCKVCGEVLLLKYEAERHNKMHKKESTDLVSMPMLSEEELSVTSSAENLLCEVKSEQSLQTSDVSDKKRDVKVPLSSIKTENYIGSGSVNTLSAIIVKEEPFYEDKNAFNDAVLTADVEQRNVVMVTDEVNDFNHDENIVDPLA